VFFCLDEVGPLGEALRSEGFVVEALDRRPGLDWAVGRRLRGLMRKHQVGLLHAHQYTPFFYAALARGWVGPRVPILFTEHGRHYPDPRKWKRILANQVLLGRGDRVTAVGQFVKDALVRNEGIKADRITVVPNGIEVERFLVTPAQRAAAGAELRRGLGLSDDARIVLQVARFHPVKDHATAVRAFHLLDTPGQAAPRANVHLVLVGDGERRGAIEQLVGELSLQDPSFRGRVHFLGVRTDIPRLTAGADVFMLSSLSEGISVTLLEAMAAGLPIAATAVGGNAEVVVDEETGLLAPRRDIRALATALGRLCDDEALRRRLGAAGLARVRLHFTQARMHEQYAALYEAMLSPLH
jgi:glycosyltransferase involved in cell wall biosynthesis